MSNVFPIFETSSRLITLNVRCFTDEELKVSWNLPVSANGLSHLRSEKDSRNGKMSQRVKLWKNGRVEGGKRGENNQ